MRIPLVIVALVCGLAWSSGADAAPVLQINGSGILTGARGVDVGGTLFDVNFVDSSCLAIYPECDSPDDFAFDNFGDAALASQALLDQVFIGQFDDDPQLTLGCYGQHRECVVFTPYAVSNSFVDLHTAINSEVFYFPDSVRGDTQAFYTSSLADCDNCVYADWTRATAIPEPSSLLLLGSGIAGAAVKLRRKRTQQAM